MVLMADLRTSVEEEEVLEESRGGAALLRACSGEIGDQEDFLIRAERHLQPGGIISNNYHLETQTNGLK